MSDQEREGALKKELVESLRAARDEARNAPDEPVALAPYAGGSGAPTLLPRLETAETEPAPTSPDRSELNRIWNVSEAERETSAGALGRAFAPLRAPLRRFVRFALGPLAERQTEMNSAQVRFDNELVSYVDERFDRMSRHYDRVLGLHGRRMEEIDERHLILQQELIRHVHDLVARIELVFEAAEQNHLYLEGTLRETREELSSIAARLLALEKENE
jgi:hypothetical protein